MISRYLLKTFCAVILAVGLFSLPVMAGAQGGVEHGPTDGAGVAPKATVKAGPPVSDVLTGDDSGKVGDAKAEAKRILSQPEYRDGGEFVQRNWFSKSSENVANAIADFMRKLFGQRSMPQPKVSAAGFDAVTAAIWVVIALAIIGFLAWAISQISPGARRAKRMKVGGLMDDDEPERSADEWLLQADDLAASGRFREAVRCLYIACLVRLDEAGVARLIRSETNWEHLRRIEESSRRPVGLDFRVPTQKFDLIWYGFRTEGQPDVDDFRVTYTELCRILNIKIAA